MDNRTQSDRQGRVLHCLSYSHRSAAVAIQQSVRWFRDVAADLSWRHLGKSFLVRLFLNLLLGFLSLSFTMP